MNHGRASRASAAALWAWLLLAVVATVGGCDNGVEFQAVPDFSALVWSGPPDAAVAPDLGPGCSSNADCRDLGNVWICCSKVCVNAATDPKNCGGCDYRCPPIPNGTAVCIQGTCPVDDCGGPGFARCDGVCFQLSADPENCGACGHVCQPFANGLPTCNQGKCTAICAPGFADCDNDIQNGCETDTSLDVTNCGGCGKVCPAPLKAKAACDLGKCGFRCALGYGDCDSNPVTGCETDVAVDPSNCGHCGNACPPNTKCVSSRCQ